MPYTLLSLLSSMPTVAWCAVLIAAQRAAGRDTRSSAPGRGARHLEFTGRAAVLQRLALALLLLSSALLTLTVGASRPTTERPVAAAPLGPSVGTLPCRRAT